MAEGLTAAALVAVPRLWRCGLVMRAVTGVFLAAGGLDGSTGVVEVPAALVALGVYIQE